MVTERKEKDGGEETQLNVNIPADLHLQIKQITMASGVRLKHFVISALKAYSKTYGAR